MLREMLITLTGALSVVFSAYVVFSLALKYLPMEPGIAKLYSIGWFTVKWPALFYVPYALVGDVLLDDHLEFKAVLISSVLLVAWWWLRHAGDNKLTRKIKRKIMDTIVQRRGLLAVIPVRAEA